MLKRKSGADLMLLCFGWHVFCSVATDRARFSYFGGRSGPLWQRLTYHLQPAGLSASGSLHIEDASGAPVLQEQVQPSQRRPCTFVGAKALGATLHTT